MAAEQIAEQGAAHPELDTNSHGGTVQPPKNITSHHKTVAYVTSDRYTFDSRRTEDP